MYTETFLQAAIDEAVRAGKNTVVILDSDVYTEANAHNPVSACALRAHSR